MSSHFLFRSCQSSAVHVIIIRELSFPELIKLIAPGSVGPSFRISRIVCLFQFFPHGLSDLTGFFLAISVEAVIEFVVPLRQIDFVFVITE
jgi:hypothetical protein